MPASAAKKPGDQVRVRRESADGPRIEAGWRAVRFEPDSGDLVAEKDGVRVACRRSEWTLLNFAGSDAVWDILTADREDAVLQAALAAWAKLDFSRLMSGLLEHGRGLDPSFAGCQTVADLAGKASALSQTCSSAIDLLRTELKRAEAEYSRCPTGSAFDNDRKDDLLDRWRCLQDKYAARAYLRDRILPACLRLVDCLRAAEAARPSGA